jgi:hypothetical protein
MKKFTKLKEIVKFLEFKNVIVEEVAVEFNSLIKEYFDSIGIILNYFCLVQKHQGSMSKMAIRFNLTEESTTYTVLVNVDTHII